MTLFINDSHCVLVELLSVDEKKNEPSELESIDFSSGIIEAVPLLLVLGSKTDNAWSGDDSSRERSRCS